MARDVVLVDLSSIAYPIWHTSSAEPDPNACSQKVVARIRALAGDKPYVAICCDKGKSFRHELSPSYKANRPEQDAALQHQITLAKEMLEADGFPVWAIAGFEADDLIASAVNQAVDMDEVSVAIVSADKDLLQLVGDQVRAISVKDGATIDAAAVKAKFGVTPEQMRDYLTLVGDKSDNVKGANGIGEVKARELLARFGSIEQMYADMKHVGTVSLKMTPALVTNLREFEPRYAQTQALITLRTDAPIPFADIFKTRQPKDHDTSFGMDVEDDMADETTAEVPSETSHVVPPATSAAEQPATRAIAIHDPEILPAPSEWERGLDPRSMREARVISKDLHDSRMFLAAYGTPQAVLSTIMLGRELGLPAMASLRSVHVIEGKHSLSASLMVAIILKSGLSEFFEPIEFDEKHATWETKRVTARNPVKLTHTIEMARAAWSKGDEAWNKSGWGRNPTDMLNARATARLARMVYPDILAGLYTPEELEEVRQSVA